MLRSYRQTFIPSSLLVIAFVCLVTAYGQAQRQASGASPVAAEQAGKVLRQRIDGRSPVYVVRGSDIQKVADMEFWRALNYLLSELFPRKESAWHSWLQRYVFYVDSTKTEPEDVEDLPTQDVKEILVWDNRIAPAPMAFPALARTRYVVSMQTGR